MDTSKKEVQPLCNIDPAVDYLSNIINDCAHYDYDLIEIVGRTLRWTLRTKSDQRLVRRALRTVDDYANVVPDNELDRSYIRAQKALGSMKKRLEKIFSKIEHALRESLDDAINDCIDVDDKGHGVLDADPTEVAIYVMYNNPKVESMRLKHRINVESMACLVARWQKDNVNKKQLAMSAVSSSSTSL
jgi:hypothetical protein